MIINHLLNGILEVSPSNPNPSKEQFFSMYFYEGANATSLQELHLLQGGGVYPKDMFTPLKTNGWIHKMLGLGKRYHLLLDMAIFGINSLNFWGVFHLKTPFHPTHIGDRPWSTSIVRQAWGEHLQQHWPICFWSNKWIWTKPMQNCRLDYVMDVMGKWI